ncbi:MAG: hypothetical protein DMG57_24785 [Acidobacteria bacterium]|nr:MAG: hypothetical protein DMG57_24785 [Acidobacteriota bacterium]
MRGKPFQAGNKYGRGRPRGSRNKVTRVCQDTLDSHAENLIKKCLVLAYQGNPTAMRLCMERLMPARRQRTLQFKLPPIKTITDVAVASESVVSGVARGQLTPAEGQAFSGMLEDRRRVIETQHQEPRIRALEDLNKPSSGPR